MVIVPSTINDTTAGNSKRTATMYITGNDNTDPFPTTASPSEDVLLPAVLAQATGTVGATLFQVPNQPLVFSDDKTRARRSEDSLVGYSWHRFLDAIKVGEPDPDAEMIILLPMAKAAMAAMDAITEFTTELKAGKIANAEGAVIPAPVDRVELQQVRVHRRIADGVVDPCDLNSALEQRLQRQLADPAQPVQRIDGHAGSPAPVLAKSSTAR